MDLKTVLEVIEGELFALRRQDYPQRRMWISTSWSSVVGVPPT